MFRFVWLSLQVFYREIHLFLNLVSNAENFLDKNVSEPALIAIPAISVAIILPIAMFLGDKNNSESPIDKNVIFSQILSFKTFVPALVVCSIFLVLNLRLLSIAALIFLLVKTLTISHRAYKWFCSYEEIQYKMTYRQKIRIRFLESLKNPKEILETWNLILSDEELMSKNQVGLMKAYIEVAQKLPNTKKNWARAVFYNCLLQNIERINFNDTEVFRQLLEFSSSYYKEQKKRDITQDRGSDFELKAIFLKLLHIALDQGNRAMVLDYMFFEQLEKISNDPRIDNVEFNKDFLRDFFYELEKDDNIDIYSIWHGKYLDKIVVTRETLQNEQTREFAAAIFQVYGEYVWWRAASYDDLGARESQVLEKVTEHILRDVDPRFWFDMMTFCCRSFPEYPGRNIYYSMTRAWCEKGRNFGLCGRLKTFSSDTQNGSRDDEETREELNRKIEESNKKEYKETAYLIGVLHRWLWNPNECKKILKEIKIIKEEKIFDSKSGEFCRLERIEWCFERMCQFIKDERKASKAYKKQRAE